jgi:uncharacterized protein DUF4350
MRYARGSRDLVLVGISALLMVAVAGIAAIVAPPSEGVGVRGSSLSTGSEGAKAGFLLLRRLGYVVQRNYEPLVSIEAQPETDVLVLMAPRQAPSRLDVQALTRFIEAGGVVLVAERPAFVPALRWGGDVAAGGSALTSPGVVLPSPLALGAARVRMDHREHHAAPRPPFATVFADARGPAVVAARMGAGRVVYWASALPATNAAIDETGHVELLVNAIGPPLDRRVIWDEHYHGHVRSAWSYTKGTPLPAALAQLGVIGLAAIVTVSFRRRPLRAVPEPPRTAPLEFIDTMGGLYARASASATAVSVALAHLRRRLVAAAGLPADATDARIARAAAPRAGIAPEALAALLDRARDASRGGVGDRAAVDLVRALQDTARRRDRQGGGRGSGR